MSTHAKNTNVVKLSDGREVLYSYGVAVAAFIPSTGYVKLDHKFSVTTSKHVNAYTEHQALLASAENFAELIAPLAHNWPVGVL